MSNFDQLISHIIEIEGGYKVINIPGDRGGQTYAGISRRSWGHWLGWELIDKGVRPDSPELIQLCHAFYREEYWERLRGDEIEDIDVARALFSAGVLSGKRTAVRLMQMAAETTPDGSIGPKSIAAINSIDPELLLLRFTVLRIARYSAIVKRSKSQRKFFLGWVNRCLGELEDE